LEFDLEHRAFRHLKVRQAVAHAIDKQVILSTAFFGYGEIATGPIPRAQARFYTPDVPTYPFDLAKAERLLD
ncbi:ABC transporter substrate-binding protein, partial [Citrobacter freundii]|uniref:ABC transporter substrate-binding protein n=1 Tax=Citrobacter freundii TaxID=546 RepID=UPI001EF93383